MTIKHSRPAPGPAFAPLFISLVLKLAGAVVAGAALVALVLLWSIE